MADRPSYDTKWRHSRLIDFRSRSLKRNMPILDSIERTLDAAERLNPKLNSFLSIERDHSSARAKELDASSDDVPLKGLAIAVKDNICTKDMRTSCGLQILFNYKAHYDATAIARLNRAGAIVVGKTNMDEFAIGSSNENSAIGLAKNPCDVTSVTVGSSGGSAVAVASGVDRA